MVDGKSGKLIIFSAPSGAGKTMIVHALTERFPRLEFSISATSRQPRHNEQHGRDYYFLSAEEFRKACEEERFVEWEEVYAGTRYGTLKSEMERIWRKGNIILFDVDVMGGIRLKSIFGANALSIFVMPPSVAALRERLTGRGTDSPETIEKRIAKAEQEISYADRFDYVVINDDLQQAIAEVETLVAKFIKE